MVADEAAATEWQQKLDKMFPRGAAVRWDTDRPGYDRVVFTTPYLMVLGVRDSHPVVHFLVTGVAKRFDLEVQSVTKVQDAPPNYRVCLAGPDMDMLWSPAVSDAQAAGMAAEREREEKSRPARVEAWRRSSSTVP